MYTNIAHTHMSNCAWTTLRVLRLPVLYLNL